MSFIPPTEGSKRCMCWQGYTGPSQEELNEQEEISGKFSVQLWPDEQDQGDE